MWLKYSICIIVLSSLVLAVPHHYEFTLLYDNGEISILGKEVVPGEPQPNFGQDYSLQLNDHIEKFSIPNTILYDNWEEEGNVVSGGTLVLNKTTFVVQAPYIENIQQTKVFNGTREWNLIEKNYVESNEPMVSQKNEEQKTFPWWVVMVLLSVAIIPAFFLIKLKKT